MCNHRSTSHGTLSLGLFGKLMGTTSAHQGVTLFGLINMIFAYQKIWINISTQTHNLLTLDFEVKFHILRERERERAKIIFH